MSHPTIDLLGVTLSEPVTVLTDIILAVFCFYFYVKISRMPSLARGKAFFAQFFLWMSLCTFLGGVMGHGFLPQLGAVGKYPARILTPFSMFWLQLGVIELLHGKARPNLIKALQWIAILMVPLFIGLSFWYNHFSYAIFHNMFAAIMIIPILVFCIVKYKLQGTDWVLYTLLISSVIPYFQINRIGVNRWFTYHDVCHVIMLLSFIVLYKGATKLYNNIEY